MYWSGSPPGRSARLSGKATLVIRRGIFVELEVSVLTPNSLTLYICKGIRIGNFLPRIIYRDYLFFHWQASTAWKPLVAAKYLDSMSEWPKSGTDTTIRRTRKKTMFELLDRWIAIYSAYTLKAFQFPSYLLYTTWFVDVNGQCPHDMYGWLGANCRLFSKFLLDCSMTENLEETTRSGSIIPAWPTLKEALTKYLPPVTRVPDHPGPEEWDIHHDGMHSSYQQYWLNEIRYVQVLNASPAPPLDLSSAH